MKQGNLFWGTILVVMGGLFLLNTLGILSFNVWSLFWPILLIAGGIAVLLSAMTRKSGDGESTAIHIPLEGAEAGKVKLEYGAGRLQISGGAAAGQLASGTAYGGISIKSRRDNGSINVTLSAEAENIPFGWNGGRREWLLQLNDAIPLSLEIDFGAADAALDLTSLRLRDMKIQTGASSTNVTLPAHAGQTHVKVSSGAASVNLRVPDGVAARIKSSGGLSSVNVDTNRFPSVGSNTYQSANYETAENKIEIDAETGIGSLNIR